MTRANQLTRPNQLLRDVREALLACRIGLERPQELRRRQQDACYSPRHCNVTDPSSIGMGRLAVVRSVRIQTVGRPCCCLGNKPGEGGVPRIILEPLDDVAAPSPIKGRYLLCSSCTCGPASQTLLKSSRSCAGDARTSLSGVVGSLGSEVLELLSMFVQEVWSIHIHFDEFP